MDNTYTENAGIATSEKRSSFSGSLGYILAVAGSAVGLGNIWRFPYLAAKYGGGIFLLTYLILMVTFGYALIISETALGRMTMKSPVGAFQSYGKGIGFKFGGWINAIVPILIIPYYCVIGGWVIKYLVEYLGQDTTSVATDGYFGAFVANSKSMELWFVVFAIAVVAVILMGVKNGVEKVSKIMMPILVILSVIMAVYSITMKGGLEGVKYFLVPDFGNFSWMTIVAAMGQMFYSLSIAMGILYTYGSYINKDVKIEKTTKQIEIFDTAIAVIAGLIIIPAVFAFSGDTDTLAAGPSLMFVMIPKIFASVKMGWIIGIVFFLMVLFAALTSAISLLETSVSTFVDQTRMNRNKAVAIMSVIVLMIGTACALGFGAWSGFTIFDMSILDFLDFLTTSVMMPVAALCTCVLVVKVVKLEKIEKEAEIKKGFRLQLYRSVMIFFAPVCCVVILVSSVLQVMGVFSI